MKARPVSQSKVIMTELVLPSHTNSMGTIFGGTVMSWVDIAGAICAQRHSQRQVVTAHIDELQFVAPVYKGWVVNLKASVNFTGKSSMEVGVRVDAENPITNEVFHTASAYLTFVALDSHGKPTEISPVDPQTEDEKRRYEAAKARREHRLKMRTQL
ncbi:MAG: acyl-CoA thioesterase [Bdellovibrionales bacterium]|nr:acyl-CoA thioesterase [Bdellovibrionales bacterium]NQZ20113.1 acyl-CoA thioesterase [Bdellovibrionales bacterium]